MLSLYTFIKHYTIVVCIITIQFSHIITTAIIFEENVNYIWGQRGILFIVFSQNYCDNVSTMAKTDVGEGNNYYCDMGIWTRYMAFLQQGHHAKVAPPVLLELSAPPGGVVK